MAMALDSFVLTCLDEKSNRTTPERMYPYFFLTLDDPGAGTEQGESGIYETLHDFIWYDTIGKAQARIKSDENTKAALESFVTCLITEVTEAGEDDIAVKSANKTITGRCMTKIHFDLDYNEFQVWNLQRLWEDLQLAVGCLFEDQISD